MTIFKPPRERIGYHIRFINPKDILEQLLRVGPMITAVLQASVVSPYSISKLEKVATEVKLDCSDCSHHSIECGLLLGDNCQHLKIDNCIICRDHYRLARKYVPLLIKCRDNNARKNVIAKIHQKDGELLHCKCGHHLWTCKYDPMLNEFYDKHRADWCEHIVCDINECPLIEKRLKKLELHHQKIEMESIIKASHELDFSNKNETQSLLIRATDLMTHINKLTEKVDKT
jgi:hypothetical protein